MPPKRKHTPHSVWQVLVTDYLDDYKSRGSDWSSSRSYLCETVELAIELQRKLMIEELMETIPHRHINEEKWPRLTELVDNANDDDDIEKELKKMHIDEIGEIFDEFVKGEFVRVKQEIDIEEKKVLQEIDERFASV